MVNIQFIEDIYVYDLETKKPKLLFRKGHHAKARGILGTEQLWDGKILKGTRPTMSPNLIVDKDGEIIYMPHKGEYVIPSDKWHIENGRWVGEWDFASIAQSG